MWNNFASLKEKALIVSQLTGYNTRGVYNVTHSLSDIHEAGANLFIHSKTPPVALYHRLWDNYFDQNKSGAPLLQICHSQATAQIRNALEIYPQDRRNRIIIAAFAPSAYISPKLCMQVNHYVCPSDLIPYIDFRGRREYAQTITIVPKMPGIKQSCHEFLNPIYRPHLYDEIKEYQKILKNYLR